VAPVVLADQYTTDPPIYIYVPNSPFIRLRIIEL
jgi:hypothetical protein